ncbi:MAG: hypothetical protein QXP54_06020 [Thermofilum sp.]
MDVHPGSRMFLISGDRTLEVKATTTERVRGLSAPLQRRAAGRDPLGRGEGRVLYWRLPPRIKVLEALGCIADGRVQFVSDREARVTGSDGTRTYRVVWDGGLGITSNDNGSMYKGYLGYPSIAFLMLKGILPYDEKLAEALKGIPWRDLNEKFRSYSATENYVRELLAEKGISWAYTEAFVERVLAEIKRLKPYKIM